jgi:hypothetical protein
MDDATDIVQRGLEMALQQVWPKRAHKELLLDLGEKKPWTKVDEATTLRDVSQWLVEELQLWPAEPAEVPPSSDELATLRELGEALAGDAAPGTAAWIAGLAPAAGASAKTLANSLSEGLRSDRRDHRWLRLLARIMRGDAALDAWAYHRRCPVWVASELARWGLASHFDAGDALLCASLVALWQRRRPTEQVRANRGRARERRRTPMPIAGLAGHLVELGQIRALAPVCAKLDPEPGRALALVIIEAALTEAHFEPHPVRGRAETSSGERLLGEVENFIGTTTVLSMTDERLLRFRIERMRAWRDLRPQPPVEAILRDEPYVQASLHLEELLRSGSAGSLSFDPATPGLLMLLPQLRARGCIEP